MINKFIRTPAIIILLIIFNILPGLAQIDPLSGYSVRHFTDENGLPQNSINDLLFDDAGYLWLGSQVGLIRFNGSSFKLYYPDDKAAMESNILLLGKGPGKSLFFQTNDHNLYCYPGDNSRRLKTMNNAGPQGPWLLNDRKQLFNFTHFLSPSSPSLAAQRRAIFSNLYSRNNGFYVVDSSSTYIISGDSLYYYNGQDLTGLEKTEDPDLRYLQLGSKLYLIKKATVKAVYEAGAKIAGSYLIKGLAEKDVLPKAAHHYSLFASCNTGHLLIDQQLYRLYLTDKGQLAGQFLLDVHFAANISAVEYNKHLDMLLIATLTDGFWCLRRNPFQSPGFAPPCNNCLPNDSSARKRCTMTP